MALHPAYVIFLLIAGVLLVVALVQSREARHTVKRRLSLAPRANDRQLPKGRQGLMKRTTDNEISKAAMKRAADFYQSADPESVARIRLQLIRSGYFDPKAAGLFFLARGASAIFFLLASLFGLYALAVETSALGMIGYSILGGGLGYFLPNVHLSSRIAQRTREYREGLPDFMDLMIVCADAGMSMEASIDRVSREIATSYPALADNLQILSIELRAGRSLEDALKSLSERLGLDEVRSLAVLLQQSRKLGTSLAQTLRIFSEDMRHKRMSKAEEKAHALPAKMSIPVTVCILPVIMLVATIPVIVTLATGNY